jgi:ATP-dependent DNA ligase
MTIGSKKTRARKSKLTPPLLPMEAISVDTIPVGDEWQYEPKWDGFRCVVFRDGDRVYLQSKSGQPLGRYFPEVVAEIGKLGAKHFVLDSELVVAVGGRFSFDDLLQRIHPAESRVCKLATERPAMLIVFDLLMDERGTSLLDQPLALRRPRLERFADKYFSDQESIRLSPATTELAVAKKWFKVVGGNLDGIIAKRLDVPYRVGEREGMVKIKHLRTADCVVGGFRYAEGRKVIGSLLLGLYDRDGLLNHVGFTSSFSDSDRRKLTEEVEALIKPPGFTGRAPGGPSRWSTRRSDEWKPLRPKLVVEVQYDHFTGERFRHGTRLLRWRPEKAPKQCTMDQVARRGGRTLKLLESAGT